MKPTLNSYVRAPVGAGASNRLCQVLSAPAGRERGWRLLILRSGDVVTAPEKWLRAVDESAPEVAAEIAACRERDRKGTEALEASFAAMGSR